MTGRHTRLIVLVVLALAVVSTSTSAQDLEPPLSPRQIAAMQSMAAQGDRFSQFFLGGIYAEGGWGVAQDDVRAVYWYELAAEQGQVDAQSRLGIMYSKGRGVSQNSNLAFYWSHRAAKQGDIQGMGQAGMAYCVGQPLGVQQDRVTGSMWLLLVVSMTSKDDDDTRWTLANQALFQCRKTLTENQVNEIINRASAWKAVPEGE